MKTAAVLDMIIGFVVGFAMSSIALGAVTRARGIEQGEREMLELLRPCDGQVNAIGHVWVCVEGKWVRVEKEQ